MPATPQVGPRASETTRATAAAGQKSGPIQKTLTYRAVPALVALCVFLAISALYLLGRDDAYFTVLRFYGIEPFQFPFVDISGSLAAWDCTRLGVDVVEYDPCDVLGRGYSYSPLWMVAAPVVPLGRSATGPVGWLLGLLFILSCTLLPPARRRWELVLVVLATSSTMVAFAIERANPDIILFLMALLVGFLARGPLPARFFAYLTALLAALIKLLSLTLLILSFRERVAVFLANGLAMAGLVALFWSPISTISSAACRSFRSAPISPICLRRKTFRSASPSWSSRYPAARRERFRWPCRRPLYALLLAGGAVICRDLLTRAPLRQTFARIGERERIFLVIGSVLIVGCFFAGQNIGYRGIFLLFVLPACSRLDAVLIRRQMPLPRRCDRPRFADVGGIFSHRVGRHRRELKHAGACRNPRPAQAFGWRANWHGGGSSA